jgi:hypothetical protein
MGKKNDRGVSVIKCKRTFFTTIMEVLLHFIVIINSINKEPPCNVGTYDSDAKEKSKWQIHKGESTNAKYAFICVMSPQIVF